MLTHKSASTGQTSVHKIKHKNFQFRSFQMVDFVPFLLFYSTSKSPKFETETNRYEEGILHIYPMDNLWIVYENQIKN